MRTSPAQLLFAGGLASLLGGGCVLASGGTATRDADAGAASPTGGAGGGSTTTTTGAGGATTSTPSTTSSATTTSTPSTTTGTGGHGGAASTSAGGAGGHGGASTSTSTTSAGGAGGHGGATCGASSITCDGVCVDPLDDPAHCGASLDCVGPNAGVACKPPAVCEAGACTDPCSPLATCAGACVDTQTSPSHCGACGVGCPVPPHSVGTCTAGKCGSACAFGWEDADGDPANGCEATPMLLWLDASTLALADGDPVATWPDVSGHARDAKQATGDAQPTFVIGGAGRRAVRFDGAKDHLVTPTFQLFASASGGLTIAFVFRADDLASQRFLLQNPQTNCANNLELGYRTGSADRPNFGVHAGCSHATVTTTSIAKSTWMVRVVTVLPQGNPPLNVTVHDDAGVNLPMEKDVGGWVAAGGYGTKVRKLVVGGRDDNNDGKYNSFHKGDIAELQIWGSALDDAGRAAVLAYLGAKYP